MRVFCVFLASLICSLAHAQLELSHGPAGILEPGTEVKKVGDRYLVRSSGPLSAISGELILAETEAANVEFSVTNQAREPVLYQSIPPSGIFVSTPGKLWVEVTAIDFAKNIYGRKTIVVDVGSGPSPPGPGPTPPTPDDGEFDGLASRVSSFAAKLGMDHRSQIAGVLGNAADKMRSFQFRTPAQAKEYIAKNWPSCTSPECKSLWDLVTKDAERRLLSWQEMQQYYRVVAKGVLQ